MESALSPEWTRLIENTAKEARSLPARSKVLEFRESNGLAPNLESARLLQDQTTEMSFLVDRDGLWSTLTDLEDPFPILMILKKSGVASLNDLKILRLWFIALETFTEISPDEIKGEHFKRALKTLRNPRVHLRKIDQILSPNGELKESATPKLHALFTEQRSQKREIEIRLNDVLKEWDKKGVLQDQYTDFRDGRYVLPVRMGSQGEVEGIIHETSSSRQTAFIEPKEVTRLNNRLREVESGIEEEILRILREISDQLRPDVQEFDEDFGVLTYWDAVQARARIARVYGGRPIDVVAERRFHLNQTVHPLLFFTLKSDSVIRNDVELVEPHQVLLISGPNTGGKTVLLKTLGFAGLCARAGMFMPGVGKLTVPFFDSMFADVGDSQSIEDSISSFSGHILRFKETLERLTDQSLVLLDEMNSATDPEEGAALSRAFLETLMNRGAMVVATTHDPHLKAYALNEKRIMNASMAFDDKSKHPTYRLILGVAGRSRALETAERLGLPPSILEHARSYLSDTHKNVEKLLSKLEADAAEAESLRREALHMKEDAEKLKNEWMQKAEIQVSALMEKTRQRIKRIQEEAQEQIRSALKKMDEARSRKAIDETRREVGAILQDTENLSSEALNEQAPEIVQAVQKKKAAEGVASAPTDDSSFKIGDKVRVPKWKTLGDIVSMDSKSVRVAMGALQVNLSLSDIEPLTQIQKKDLGLLPSQKKSKFSLQERPSPPASSIDLRGKRLDEAMRDLEAYLDLAFRSGSLQEVNIIHGVGTGAIRENARVLLKRLPYVKTFRDGGFGAGGSGATLVELDV